MNWAATIALMLVAFVAGLWIGVDTSMPRPPKPYKETPQDRLNKFLIELSQAVEHSPSGTWSVDADGLPEDAIDQVVSQMKLLAAVHRTPMHWTVAYNKRGRTYVVTSEDQ